MLSARIYVLEKYLVDTRASTGVIEHNGTKSTRNPFFEVITNSKVPNIDKLVDRVNKAIDLLELLNKKEYDIAHIRTLVQHLQQMLGKEAGLERLVEEIHGFMDYFNDQWNKFNMNLMEQNVSISWQARSYFRSY